MIAMMAADPTHLDKLHEGAEKWNEWRAENPEIIPNLRLASLNGGSFNNFDLRGAILIRAQLQNASLNGTHLEGANLDSANLECAKLREAHLEGTTLKGVNLGGADLRGIFLSKTTQLEDAQLTSNKGTVWLVDADWGNVNLGAIDWDNVKVIGDEERARKSGATEQYRTAMRCCRQLSTELRQQGLGEEADRFAYRGQRLRRTLWRRQKKWLTYLFSCCLDFLVGYGYKPGRSLIAYLATLAAFTAFYMLVPNFGAITEASPPTTTPLSLLNAILFSLISFHGRVNAPDTLSFNGLYAWISILETLVGLLVELCFIAAFTQRFLGGKS